jgi:hypothetical protein
MTAHRQVRVAGDGETASGHAELDRRRRTAAARMERTAEPARRADRGRPRLARDHRVDSPTRGAAAAAPALDQVLELLERRGLSASELRVLLAVRHNEVTVSDLSRTLGRPPVEIRRIGARLYALGFLRWRHDGRTMETVLGATRAGLTAVRPLTAAAGPRM